MSIRDQRGATVAELLTVIVIMGLFMSGVVMAVGPVIHAPNEQQAKVQAQQAVVRAMYVVQRDLRLTPGAGALYSCTTSGVCSSPGPALSPVPVLVAISPLLKKTSGGASYEQAQTDSSSGKSSYVSAVVYFVASNTDGSTKLQRALVTLPVPGASPTAATLAAVVSKATATGAAFDLADDVAEIDLSFTPSTSIVGFALRSRTNVGGHQNTLSYRSDVYARNI